MKSVLMSVVLLFLVVNVGVLYYIVLFGDVADFSKRLDLLERRVDTLVMRDGKDPLSEGLQVNVGEEVVVLTDQQKNELVDGAVRQVEGKVKGLITKEVFDALELSKSKNPTVKEYYIPIGRAVSKSTNNEWRLTPVQVDVDLTPYGEVKAVYFEGTLRIPSGNGKVYVRLFDTETGVVGGSELDGEGYDGVFRRTEAITLPEGRRTLKVDMRTSLDYEGVLENGRLLIVTE